MQPFNYVHEYLFDYPGDWRPYGWIHQSHSLNVDRTYIMICHAPVVEESIRELVERNGIVNSLIQAANNLFEYRGAHIGHRREYIDRRRRSFALVSVHENITDFFRGALVGHFEAGLVVR